MILSIAISMYAPGAGALLRSLALVLMLATVATGVVVATLILWPVLQQLVLGLAIIAVLAYVSYPQSKAVRNG